jgi:hypothetical protein
LDAIGIAPIHPWEVPDTPGIEPIAPVNGFRDADPPLVWQLMQRFALPFTVVS